ncbi:MAG: hypothetical protein ACYTG0_01055 [Planctomycetota bacterium]|jgi:hypothetical protein
MCDPSEEGEIDPEVATAKVGGWSFAVVEPTGDSESWLIEISPPGASFIDLYFNMEGPELVEKVLRFIQNTRGQRQYGDLYELPTGQKIPTFRDPSITIGQYVGVDVDLFKDGSEKDHYFVVIAGPHRNVIRLRVFGSELNNVITALESLHEQLADYR